MRPGNFCVSAGASCLLLFSSLTRALQNRVCVDQAPGRCLGVYECNNSNIGETECALYAFDNNCTSLRSEDAPYDRPRPGDRICFEELTYCIVVSNVTETLEPSSIGAVFAYADGQYGQGSSASFRGDCSSGGSRCAFMRAGFPC